DFHVTGVQTCALPIYRRWAAAFLDTQWPAEPEAGLRVTRRRFAVAMATIAGIFELVADWSRHQVEADLAVAGMGAGGEPDAVGVDRKSVVEGKRGGVG